MKHTDHRARQKRVKIETGIYAYGNKFHVQSPSYLGTYDSLLAAQQARSLALEAVKQERLVRESNKRNLRLAQSLRADPTEYLPDPIKGREIRIEPGIYLRNGAYIVRSPVYLGAFPTLHEAQQARLASLKPKKRRKPEPPEQEKSIKPTSSGFEVTYKGIYLGIAYSTPKAEAMLLGAKQAYKHLRPKKLKIRARTYKPTTSKTNYETRVDKGIYKCGNSYLVRSPRYLGSFPTLEDAQNARGAYMLANSTKAPTQP